MQLISGTEALEDNLKRFCEEWVPVWLLGCENLDFIYAIPYFLSFYLNAKFVHFWFIFISQHIYNQN